MTLPPSCSKSTKHADNNDNDASDDAARDSHDFFNLIVLIPVCVLNGMNWKWDMLLQIRNTSISDAWTGEWFLPFFQITALYFVVDLLWVALVPNCVKSPTTIILHHIATLLYISIPYLHPDLRCFMGACMSVEVNTWCMIARRVFRLKFISILFYSTWFLIRCIVYPMLWLLLFDKWKAYSTEVGYWPWSNVIGIGLPLHTVFCLLNLKWTKDLLLSKLRYWSGSAEVTKVEKGL